MLSGELDQRIEFKALVETNVSGVLKQSFVPLASAWGHVISQRGNEAFEASRVNARETIRVKVRFRDDITVEHRAGWNGKDYNIKYIDQSQRRAGWTWFTAEAQK